MVVHLCIVSFLLPRRGKGILKAYVSFYFINSIYKNISVFDDIYLVLEANVL